MYCCVVLSLYGELTSEKFTRILDKSCTGICYLNLSVVLGKARCYVLVEFQHFLSCLQNIQDAQHKVCQISGCYCSSNFE